MALPIDVFYACLTDVDYLHWQETGIKRESMKHEQMQAIKDKAKERAAAKNSTLPDWWVR